MVEGNKTVILLHRPGLKERFFFFLSGIITSVPLTLFIDSFANNFLAGLPNFYAILFSAVILAPFLEEFAKAFPLFYRHGETEKSIFTLGFLVGLGFGIFEFFTYVLLLGAPILLRLPAIFFHGASTSITAYGIATKRVAGFYLMAVALHFLINFSALLHLSLNNSALFGPWLIGSYFATAITYLSSWRLYQRTSEKIVD